MRLPLKLYVDELTCREWSHQDDDSSKCYHLQIEFPDESMNKDKFICSMTKNEFKINYHNIHTGDLLPDKKIIEILTYLNIK